MATLVRPAWAGIQLCPSSALLKTPIGVPTKRAGGEPAKANALIVFQDPAAANVQVAPPSAD
jgi:hypothetical protein